MSNNHFGFVSLIGETNSGKSTLLNKIIGTKVSITSRKVQTTRNQILGVYMDDIYQIAFIDTPGIFNPNKKLDQQMISTAYRSMWSVDIIIIMLDCNKGITNTFSDIINKLSSTSVPKMLVINKVDIIDKPKLLELVSYISEYQTFDDIYMISALRKSGLNELITGIKKYIPKRSWLFDKNQISNSSLEFNSSEITREKIYHFLHQELPYHIIVQTKNIVQSNKRFDIYQTIFVINNSHKKIVIGKGGKSLKAIGSAARHELENMLQAKVYLNLFVKVSDQMLNDIIIGDYTNNT